MYKFTFTAYSSRSNDVFENTVDITVKANTIKEAKLKAKSIIRKRGYLLEMIEEI